MRSQNLARRNLFSLNSSKRTSVAVAIAAMVSAQSVYADVNWTGGTSTDWNTASNWSGAPGGQNVFVNTNTGNIATITANQSFTPVDIMVGVGGGANGQVNHISGTVTTGAVNWAFIGCNTGNGVYNLADTTTTGGTTTGFGQGSGSLGIAGNLYVGGRGWDTGGLGTLNVNTSGTLNAGFIALGEGNGGTGTGNMNVDNGTVNVNGELWVSGWSTGNMNQSGGTVNVGSWLPIGRTGTGIYNLTGGTVNAATNSGNITIGSFGGANGTLNISGGTMQTPRAAYVAEGGTGTINVSGTGLLSIGSSTEGLRLGANGGTGTVNLDGGTIETKIITQGTGLGAFSFNGGVVKAMGSSATFMTGLTAAYVRDNGAKFDTNGFNITVGQSIIHSVFGTDAAIDGGLTKSGAGAMSLSASNSYTGATIINGGSLKVTGSGDINTTSGIAVNGSGAKFVASSSTAVSPTVSVASGGIDGTGTINTVSIASNAANSVSNGDGGTGALTVGSLSFTGAGNFNLNVGSTSPEVVTTTLNASGAAGSVAVNATNSLWTAGTYNLISYSSLTGTGFSAFTKGTIGGLSNRQSATLTNPAGFISLVIAGDNPKWTGALSNVWSTATLANPKNWALITSGTPTDYIAGDVVLFNDSATTFNPTISAANVTPSSVLFNNSSNNYTLSGSFGITGAATINKSGTSALTINNANTYTGSTTLNAGTLNLNNASAIGTGALIVNGGTIDNTSGGAISLTGANPQTWNTDINFGGTNALNMGTGAISRATATTVTVAGSAPVTLGGAVGGGSLGLTKAGAGTLVLASSANTYTGLTNITAGTLSVSGSLTTSGNIDLNTGGTLNVASGGTVTSTTTAYNGNVSVAGTLNTTGDFWVGWKNGGLGDLHVLNGGTVNSDVLLIGSGDSPTAVANGTATIDAGGTVNTTRWFVVGHSGAAGTTGSATINGNLNVRTSGTQGDLEVGTWDGIVSTLNINSGASVKIMNNASIIEGVLNQFGTSTVNQTGGNVTFYSDSGTTVGGTGRLVLGGTVGWGQATGNYTYNLDGGSLTVPGITQTSTGAPVNLLNLNGGTLRAAASNADFITGSGTTINVRNNGAIIDTNGNNITVTKAFAHSNVGGDNATDGGLTKTGAGTLTITAAPTYTGSTTVNNGKLVTSVGIQNAAPVVISGGASIEVPLNGSATSVTSIKSLTTTGTGSNINIHDNDIVLNYGAGPSSYTATVNKVKSGLALLGGTGTEGITSPEVDAQTVQGTMLAVVDDGDPVIAGAITATSGFAIPAPASSVIVKYTWFGDSNLDGAVDGSDYALLDSGFTSGGALGGWVFGDYDYSGTVDGSDYALIDTGFISQNAVLPEPTTLGLLGLGAVGMLRRRRQA